MGTLVTPVFFEKNGNNDKSLIKNKYLYIIYDFNENDHPTDSKCWIFYVGDDGKTYHQEDDSPRPIHPNTYYFFVSPHKYENPYEVIKKEFCTEQITISDKFNQEVYLECNFFQLYIYPRSSRNLLEDAEDDNRKIRNLLSKYISKSNENYEKNIKEVEYNFYLDLTSVTINGGAVNDSTVKEFSIFIEINRQEADSDNELRKLYKKINFEDNNLSIQLTKSSGSSDFKFYQDGVPADEITVTLNEDGIASFQAIHPVRNLVAGDKTIKIKATLDCDENSFKEIELHTKRNEDTTRADVTGTDLNVDNELRGFFVCEFYGVVSRTYQEFIEEVIQYLFIYDLDQRATGGSNGVDGYFGSQTYTVLHRFLEQLDDDDKLPDNEEGQRSLRGLDIHEELRTYIEEEYNYSYAKGKIIDRTLLMGEIVEYALPNQVDGLWDILRYNQDHRANVTAAHMAVGCVLTSGYAVYLQAETGPGAWYEQESVGDALTLFPGNIPDGRDYAPYNNNGDYMRQKHKGRDYAAGTHLQAPGFTRLRIVDGRIAGHQMKIELEILGLGRSIYVLHLDPQGEDVFPLEKIFYPQEQIVPHPTVGYVGGAHFHIEKWLVRRNVNQSLLLDPNEERVYEAFGTMFYFKPYTSNGNRNGIPIYRKVGAGNGVTHTQPAVDPYGGDY